MWQSGIVIASDRKLNVAITIKAGPDHAQCHTTGTPRVDLLPEIIDAGEDPNTWSVASATLGAYTAGTVGLGVGEYGMKLFTRATSVSGAG